MNLFIELRELNSQFSRECAFGERDDAEMFASLAAAHDGVRHYFDVVGNFRYEDDVGAAGKA